jgi:hypothetical protein
MQSLHVPAGKEFEILAGRCSTGEEKGVLQ